MNEPVSVNTAIAHHCAEHMPLFGSDKQKNTLGILCEKLIKAANLPDDPGNGFQLM